MYYCRPATSGQQFQPVRPRLEVRYLLFILSHFLCLQANVEHQLSRVDRVPDFNWGFALTAAETSDPTDNH